MRLADSKFSPVQVYALGIFLVVALVASLATFAYGAGVPVEGDAQQYLTIGQSLAAGDGYRNPVSLWPLEPALDRMPFWPLIIAAGLRLMPGVQAEIVARLCGAFCLAATGVFIFLLCARWRIRYWLAAMAALAVALSPVMLSLSLTLLSEPSFAMLLAAALALLSGSWKERYLAALCLGLATLVRSNFVMVVPVGLLLACCFHQARLSLRRDWGWQRLVLFLFLFSLPLSLWILRNYMVSGRFPLISTIEGETLYGANNDLVANQVDLWGYWVMPDLVPGESSKRQLAEQCGSDLALNDYYVARGRGWIASHGRDLPRLLLGKLVRAFVPMPWKFSLGTYFAFSYRLLLDVALLLLWANWRSRAPAQFLLAVLTMLVLVLMTTMVFYGNNRFTHVMLEILYLPLIAVGIEQRLSFTQPEK